MREIHIDLSTRCVQQIVKIRVILLVLCCANHVDLSTYLDFGSVQFSYSFMLGFEQEVSSCLVAQVIGKRVISLVERSPTILGLAERFPGAPNLHKAAYPAILLSRLVLSVFNVHTSGCNHGQNHSS